MNSVNHGARRRCSIALALMLGVGLSAAACGSDDPPAASTPASTPIAPADSADAPTTAATTAATTAETTPAGAASTDAPAPAVFEADALAMLVNFSSGGGCDTGARVLAEHLVSHLPDGTKLFVQNVPGAGGLVGLNTLYNTSAEDGGTVGFVCGPLAFQALGAEGVEYDAAEFQWLGAIVSETQVLLAHESTGVTSAEELVSASGLISAGVAPDSAKDLGIKTFLNLLGGEYKHVTGYPGNNDIRAALERGEVNLHEETTTGVLTGVVDQVESGALTPLAQRGIFRDGVIIRDPSLPADLRTYLEVAVDVLGESVTTTPEYQALEILIKADSILRAVVYPPSTAPEVVEGLRAAVSGAFADPGYRDDSIELLGAMPIVLDGADAQDTVATILGEIEAAVDGRAYLDALAAESA